ncbi:LysR family transcriptional regulator [Pectobacterium polonicum]|uniref:LysR family transcriptional regulator n=1 Tax=Pectobacterium polonicum TaxID=2485124 RepID=A0AAE9SZE8_9GAMM|nr:LysR family transcriptional regulator [Pectobacterium polonicum]UVO07716.1 LysR family transcriptional regulator [Pectobacterium polonicum]
MIETDYSLIPIFITIVEQGSLTKAAESLHITKSAVSKKLMALEEQTGVRLITRSTRHLQLTEAGTLYYSWLKKAYQAISDGREALSRYSEKVEGTLKISAPMAFGTLHLNKVLPEFLKTWPQLHAEIVFDDKLVDLIGDGFDIAIRIGKLQDSSLISRTLSPCRSVLCASPNWFEEHGKPKNIQELAEHNCLLYSYFQAGQTWSFTHLEEQVRFTPKGNFRANNSLSLHQASLQGIGICQLPQFIVASDILAGRLIPLLPDYHLPLHHIYAVYPNREFVPKKVTAFLTFLQEKFGEESDYQKNYERVFIDIDKTSSTKRG